MIRETIILLSILLMLQPSDAIKCWRCSTRSDPSCDDPFSNKSIPIATCTQRHEYDLTPIEYCIKIKHKEAEGLVFDRGCDRKETYKDAEYFRCNTDYCNAAENHRPKSLLTALFTSFALLAIKLLRL